MGTVLVRERGRIIPSAILTVRNQRGVKYSLFCRISNTTIRSAVEGLGEIDQCKDILIFPINLLGTSKPLHKRIETNPLIQSHLLI